MKPFADEMYDRSNQKYIAEPSSFEPSFTSRSRYLELNRSRHHASLKCNRSLGFLCLSLFNHLLNGPWRSGLGLDLEFCAPLESLIENVPANIGDRQGDAAFSAEPRELEIAQGVSLFVRLPRCPLYFCCHGSRVQLFRHLRDHRSQRGSARVEL